MCICITNISSFFPHMWACICLHMWNGWWLWKALYMSASEWKCFEVYYRSFRAASEGFHFYCLEAGGGIIAPHCTGGSRGWRLAAAEAPYRLLARCEILPCMLFLPVPDPLLPREMGCHSLPPEAEKKSLQFDVLLSSPFFSGYFFWPDMSTPQGFIFIAIWLLAMSFLCKLWLCGLWFTCQNNKKWFEFDIQTSYLVLIVIFSCAFSYLHSWKCALPVLAWIMSSQRAGIPPWGFPSDLTSHPSSNSNSVKKRDMSFGCLLPFAFSGAKLSSDLLWSFPRLPQSPGRNPVTKWRKPLTMRMTFSWEIISQANATV